MQMSNLGLAFQGKHGLYDKFRERIIFPIKDIVGMAIAFGGRLNRQRRSKIHQQL